LYCHLNAATTACNDATTTHYAASATASTITTAINNHRATTETTRSEDDQVGSDSWIMDFNFAKYCFYGSTILLKIVPQSVDKNRFLILKMKENT